MVDPKQVLPPPHSKDHPKQIWVDEQIWGHRIWDNQSPWLLFLEFLTVAEACHRDGRLLDERGTYYPLLFRPYQRLHLRNILFNNEGLLQTAERYPDNGLAWAHWLRWMEDHALGGITRDFSYLRSRFPSFHQFASLVSMLRGSAVESASNKRWSSRFVFPFGPSGIYEDLNITAGNSVSHEYINFGRTGELLYLMLCRSVHAAELAPRLAALLSGENPWNRLLALLQPDCPEDQKTRGYSYLPYRSHPAFDRLAEDWLRVLTLRLPGFDVYPHLVTLGALHMLLYQLQVAAAWTNRSIHFICEVVAPKKTLVRELSALNYQENNLLPQRAVEAYLAQIPASAEWQQALAQPGAFAVCKQILEDRVRWPRDDDDYDGCSDPEALFAELRREALARHRQHAANVHRNYGREVGLSSKRGTNRLRYAPTDALLKALVLANVPRRMEYKEFLQVLFTRYGLVLGEREAEQVLGREDFDKKAFQANAARLEQRLGSLGMLRRLSDACAYVQNPLARGAS
jgi:hypothetical protein